MLEPQTFSSRVSLSLEKFAGNISYQEYFQQAKGGSIVPDDMEDEPEPSKFAKSTTIRAPPKVFGRGLLSDIEKQLKRDRMKRQTTKSKIDAVQMPVFNSFKDTKDKTKEMEMDAPALI